MHYYDARTARGPLLLPRIRSPTYISSAANGSMRMEEQQPPLAEERRANGVSMLHLRVSLAWP